jgi:hypothetical protein
MLAYATPPQAYRSDLRTVAIRQRNIMLAILGYIIAFVLQFALPNEMKLVAAVLGVAASLTAAVFVFMLALSVYSTAKGIVLGILTLVPIVGLFVLLAINGKATSILRHYGIPVGLLGASPKNIPAPGQVPIP